MSGLRTDAAETGYWEERARRFSARGRGLAAVCSYGMPGFYNAAIDLAQHRALAPWLRTGPGTRVLDLGCGIGRWSRRLAGHGATVTGLDVSPTMIEQARLRTERAGLADRCRFDVADLADLRGAVAGRFDRVLAVTVLQHVTEQSGVDAAMGAIADCLAPDGDLVLLEVAPDRLGRRTEHARLRVRDVEWYRARAASVGLRLTRVRGVDLPLNKWFLPHYPRLPRPLALGGLALLTASSLPVELLVAPHLPSLSWHKVMVFERSPTGGAW